MFLYIATHIQLLLLTYDLLTIYHSFLRLFMTVTFIIQPSQSRFNMKRKETQATSRS